MKSARRQVLHLCRSLLALSRRQIGQGILLGLMLALVFALTGAWLQPAQAQGTCPNVDITTVFASVAGYISPTISAPVGTQVLVLNPRGDVIGCAIVHTEGQYPALRFYGEDQVNTPGTPGLREGEMLQFKVNGIIVTPVPRDNWGLPLWDLIWNATRDKFAVYQVDLAPPPAVNAGIDQAIQEGDVVVLEASFTDPNDADNHAATIDWGDGLEEPGTVDQVANMVSASHTYAIAGSYTITVCVSNRNGGMACDTLRVDVGEILRFRGFVFNGPIGDHTLPMADVPVFLHGRNAEEPEPGDFSLTRLTQLSGFFNFHIIEPWVFDIFTLWAETPTDMTSVGIWSEGGTVVNVPDAQGEKQVQWHLPDPAVYDNAFYFEIPVPAPGQPVTDTIDLPLLADTWTYQANPADNYDAFPALIARTTDPGFILLKFDRTDLPQNARILDATLTVSIIGQSGAAGKQLSVSNVDPFTPARAPWQVTYANAPETENSGDAVEVPIAPGPLSFDVGAQIDEWDDPFVSYHWAYLALRASGPNGRIILDSLERHNGTPVNLNIWYTTAPPPPPAPMAASSSIDLRGSKGRP